jgi:hypothetical protein
VQPHCCNFLWRLQELSKVAGGEDDSEKGMAIGEVPQTLYAVPVTTSCSLVHFHPLDLSRATAEARNDDPNFIAALDGGIKRHPISFGTSGRPGERLSLTPRESRGLLAAGI